MTRIALILVLASSLASCSPGGSRPTHSQTSKPFGRKCPDPDLREMNDPCSPMYLHRQKPRFKRDSL